MTRTTVSAIASMTGGYDPDMARRRGQRKGYLRAENGSWLLTFRIYTHDSPQGKRQTVTIGPADGPGRLTKHQAQRFAWDHYLQPLDTATLKPMSASS